MIRFDIWKLLCCNMEKRLKEVPEGSEGACKGPIVEVQGSRN